MKTSNVLLTVLVIVLVLSLFSIWFYPSINDFMAGNVMWNGIKHFTSNFDANNIETLDNLPESSQNSTLVVIPYLDYSESELIKIKQFVEDGGSLLLMDDFGYGNTLLKYLNTDIRFSKKSLLDPLFCYKNPSLPLITDFNQEMKEDGIEVIRLNHATTLNNVPAPEAVAWSSSASFLDVNENGKMDGGDMKGPFVVAARMRIGSGNIDIVSDPSIILNSMVTDDDNFHFVNYLTHPGNGPRNILIDSSHLTQTPLDASKTKLQNARAIISNPYALIGMVAMTFIIVTRYTYRRGENIGQ